ncbi:MAG: polyprenyl synthetase family protein [Candidatus Micrarchaeota archaeon]|nr:polyprenyl synthetase family protein [Candidatus Micrarchaeota archaeon]
MTKESKEEIDIMQILKRDGESIQKYTISFLQKEPDSKLKEMMLDYPLRGGKHLRSVLALETCKAFEGDPRKMKYITIALELFQHWILIHDDIEDYSEERRGKPALHHIYGMPLANNTGDALHIKMWEVLYQNRKLIGDELTFKVMDEFIKMMDRCVKGQSMELEWVHEKRWDISEEDYYKMCKGKTTGYTFITPFRLGGIVAGISESKLKPFFGIGDDIGLAFQIEDDILNLVGEKEKYGKEIAGDIYEGKRTLILLHLVKHSSNHDRKKIIEIMNKDRDNKTEKEVEFILSLMKKYGSIDYAKEKAIFFAKRARKNFDKHYSFMKDSEAKRFIQGLFDFVINREM